VRDLAAFRFTATGTVEVTAFSGVSYDEVHDVWLRSVLPLVVQAQGTEVLHASAVLGGSGVVAFCGVATSGKSTFAAALRQSYGLPLIADDALPFVVDDSTVTAWALPFRLRLRESTARVLQLPRTNPEEQGKTAPLAMIVMLDAGAAEEPAFTQVAATDAVGAMLRHAYCFSLDDAKQQLFDVYVRLCALVPVWRLAYPQQLERLPRVRDALYALVT
jgi:hypothetical protein